ncbi:MAG: hypothetical protein J2P28_18625 [Actinobacteria bacterium]|nr:hypothetical protein [Actinomycetota bacterium]
MSDSNGAGDFRPELQAVLAETRALVAEVRADRATVDAYRAEFGAYRAEVVAWRRETAARFDSIDHEIQRLAELLMGHRHGDDGRATFGR